MSLATQPQLLNGFLGGLLIGTAALLLLLANGRIAGISSIAGRGLSAPLQPENRWRLLFLLGLIGGAALFQAITGSLNIQLPEANIQLLAAAVLVGVGTRLGAGCTSGHGVCGMGRRSPRSAAATALFMATAILTVAATGQLSA